MFYQIPMSQDGLEYQAVKDFCKWYKLKPLSKYVPMMVGLGRHYINESRKQS